MILSTGFRFSLDRLSFLSPAVRAGIVVRDGWPALDRSFRSSDQNLFFVGYAAEDPFGSISRFVPGTKVHLQPESVKGSPPRPVSLVRVPMLTV